MAKSYRMQDSSAPVPGAVIAAVEKVFGVQMPPDLKAFYVKHDGGVFKADLVDLGGGETTILNTVFSLSSNDFENAGEEYVALREDNRIPRLALPIGDDPGGNYFLVSFEPETYGQIFFWNHEQELPVAGERFEDFENVRPVARSFDEFIAGLKESADVD